MKILPSRTLRVVALAEAYDVTGALKPLLAFAEELRSNPQYGAVDLRLFAFRRYPNFGENALSRACESVGARVTPIREHGAFDASILGQISTAFQRVRPDLVLSLATKSHFLVRSLRLHRKRPWIALHHGYTRMDLKNVAYNQLDRWSLQAANGVITVCEAFIPELLRAGVLRQNIRVLHNPVKPYVAPDREKVEQLRKAYGISNREIVLFTAGRLSKEKGHIDLIDALRKLRQVSNLPRFRTIIAGDGPERGAIEQRIQDAGIDPTTVLLTGFQPDLTPFYAMSHVFVLPSHSEGSPNVLLEALAAGLPVVATRAGGTPEILREPCRAGLLAESRNPDDLASKLAMVLTDPARRADLGRAASQLSLQFSPSQYAAQLFQILSAAATQGNITSIPEAGHVEMAVRQPQGVEAHSGAGRQ